MPKQMHPAKQESFEKVKKAIVSIKRSKDKMSINKIAKKAGIERKTIYNNPDILQYCKQEIEVQNELKKASEEVSATIESPQKPSSSRQILERRYNKAKEKLKIEQDKNAKLLYQNNELVLKNHDLIARIESLERYIQNEGKNKIVPIK